LQIPVLEDQSTRPIPRYKALAVTFKRAWKLVAGLVRVESGHASQRDPDRRSWSDSRTQPRRTSLSIRHHQRVNDLKLVNLWRADPAEQAGAVAEFRALPVADLKPARSPNCQCWKGIKNGDTCGDRSSAVFSCVSLYCPKVHRATVDVVPLLVVVFVDSRLAILMA